MASEKRCVDTIRMFAADTVEKANSGHPGAPMGCAPMAHVLWSRIMKYDPKAPNWIARDRYIQSNGHACALQYTMLHFTGYEDMTLEQMQSFRQLDAITAGHPENALVSGVETSTGPLGQGISHAVGMAIAEQQAAAHFNKPGHELVHNYVYVMCGDGCMQEGVASEAGSLAGHLGLGKIIVLYDDNKITIDGNTDKSFSEDVLKRYEAYGWHTDAVADGNTDLDGIEAAILRAQAETDRPSIIKVSTTIGLGSSKQNTGGVHGAPLGKDDMANTKKHYGLDPSQSFILEPEVAKFYQHAAARAAQAHTAWTAKFTAYKAAFPELAAEFERREAGKMPDGWQDKLPRYTPADPKKATRQWSQDVLQALCDAVPEATGGSADLQPSNGTKLKNFPPFTKEDRAGRYLHFGVREHAMAAACTGIAAYGLNCIPFGATFLNFIEYALGSVRVNAICELRALWIMTHDSIGLGEDGPTHQPVEVNVLLRALPNTLFLRPGDGNEVSGSYLVACEQSTRQSVLALSRQGMPNQAGSTPEKVRLGAYVLKDVATPEIILIGTGSELQTAVEAANLLNDKRVRVVSMPCWELFDEQPAEYQADVLPAGVPAVSVEAMSTANWGRYAHGSVGVDTFGLSGPGGKVLERFGISAQGVADKARAVLEAFPSCTAPDLQKLRNL